MISREGGMSPSRILSMIPKSGYRFSENVMLQPKIEPGSESSERIRLRSGDLAMRLSRACLVALVLAFGLALGCAAAHATSLHDALAHFTTDDFSDTTAGINEVAASGDPRAEAIIRALQDGQLMFSANARQSTSRTI